MKNEEGRVKNPNDIISAKHRQKADGFFTLPSSFFT